MQSATVKLIGFRIILCAVVAVVWSPGAHASPAKTIAAGRGFFAAL